MIILFKFTITKILLNKINNFILKTKRNDAAQSLLELLIHAHLDIFCIFNNRFYDLGQLAIWFSVFIK